MDVETEQNYQSSKKDVNYTNIPTSKIKNIAKKLVLKTLISENLVLIMTFITRIFTLIISVLIARSVSKVSYGISTIYLSFLYSIITSFPILVVRKCNTTYCHDENEELELKKYQESIQLSHIVNFLLVILSIILCIIFPILNTNLYLYKIHIFIHIISAILDIYNEIIIIFMNVKLINTYKSLLLIFVDYINLFLKYIFAVIYKMDLWSFTLSRLLSSLICSILLVVLAKYKFNMDMKQIIPNFKKMKYILTQFFKVENNVLKTSLLTNTRDWIISIIVSFIERIVLSFFVQFSEDIKAEYAFIKENFSFFIYNSLYPTEENFSNLLNKLKQYKGLTTLKLSTDISTNNYTGDFSFSENTSIIKSQSAKNNSNFNVESYSYKLLKASIKLSFILGIILFTIICLLGSDFLTFIVTKKWSNDNTYKIFILLLANFFLLIINSKFTCYANSLYESDIENEANGFHYANNLLFAALCVSFTQINIAGIVYANIIYNIIRIIIGLYFTVKNEFRYEQSRTIIRHEFVSFAKHSFLRRGSVLTGVICILIFILIKYISSFENIIGINSFCTYASNLILFSNCVIIIIFEKDDLIDNIKLKINE